MKFAAAGLKASLSRLCALSFGVFIMHAHPYAM